MDNCIFCKICCGEIESIVLYEDEDVMAIRDVDPKAPTHVLVMPKRHIVSSAELTEEDGPLLGKIFSVIAKVAKQEGNGGLENGYRVVTNIGPDGGQSVPHLHFHLLGGRQMGWPPG